MMMTQKEAPSAENVSPEWHDKIMHTWLDLGNRLMGSDCPSGYFEPPQGFYVRAYPNQPRQNGFFTLSQKQ
jgi:PhnB protein